MIVYPNAKINLGLNILKKRSDGYHEISSVFYPVKELFDILEIIPSDIFSFTNSGFIIPGKSNICVKAYDLLKLDFDIPPVKIHLHKKIPIGAGLGGGSSDGAFTLRVLNQLFNLGLSSDQLAIYALKMGADCPFFIQNTPKYVTGVGETMMPIDLDLSSFDLRFFIPKLHISTVESYTQIKPKLPSKKLLDCIGLPLESWKDTIKNDFESVIFSKYPKLQTMKKSFYNEGAVYASMTGTGSVLYGIFLR